MVGIAVGGRYSSNMMVGGGLNTRDTGYPVYSAERGEDHEEVLQ